MLFWHYWTIKSTPGVVWLDVEVKQCETFSVISRDLLTLDISLVRFYFDYVFLPLVSLGLSHF